ncbi:hypothetical protein FACS189421_10710 [Bacteroidia bacterium]|nr:hypothetical protein FACS189421_10710 [Bacteroidia bacterium]
MVFFLLAGLIACNNEDDVKQPEEPQKGTTYMSVSLRIPQQSRLRAAEDPNYNSVGKYAGVTVIDHLDIYLLSGDGQVTLDQRRLSYLNNDFAFSSNSDGSDLIQLAQPFKTTPGDKQLVVVINCPHDLMTTVPDTNYLYTLSSTLPLSSLARVDSSTTVITPDGSKIYGDVLVLSGKTNQAFTIEDGVSEQDVISSGKNTIDINVTRIPSRAIVTTTAPANVVNSNGVTLGTISNITYSIAQGTNQVYLFPHTNADNTTYTWGYDYVPGPTVDYATLATTYYDYSDLVNPLPVPAKPANDSYMYLPGKFLLENTHMSGADLSTTRYRKGNTPYILIRATFTPDPAQIADGGGLSAGTFYIGSIDGKIYSSIAAAQDYTKGVQNQPVSTYTNGKVLYYVWLNPDNIQKPVNSPVIRNNIYHVNISSFKSIGVNWNPLIPPGPNTPHNPDPQPTGPEPKDPPVNPTDPLSSTDTYMTVEVTVLQWTVHTYEIDL